MRASHNDLIKYYKDSYKEIIKDNIRIIDWWLGYYYLNLNIMYFIPSFIPFILWKPLPIIVYSLIIKTFNWGIKSLTIYKHFEAVLFLITVAFFMLVLMILGL